jgi:Tfp pilus assembly protein PilO
MTKFIAPTILIAVALTGFFMFANPLYKDIAVQKSQSGDFNEALNNSKALENERDKLTQKYNTIGADNLAKLNKLLPESVDNIRLILEIEKIAAPYNMILKDVKYDVAEATPENTASATTIKSATAGKTPKDYGVWNLEFSISGSYKNFLNFTKDLESNLRIVDVESIDFSSDNGGTVGVSSVPADFYRYNFKIKTYWLKN